MVAVKINADPETNTLLRLIFIPNYNASKEHIVVPSVDFNEQISLPGEEACTTISEKFILNGSLIIGSHDATNTNVSQQLGRECITLFGMTQQEIKKFKATKSKAQISQLVKDHAEFRETVEQILKGEAFGECSDVIGEILNGILEGNDPYLIGVDFKEYIKAQDEADRIFKEKKELCKRTVLTLSRLGKMQIDKSIKTLCDTVWDT